MTTETSTDTMRAFALDAFGAPDPGAVGTVPKPEAGEGDMLIRVHAAGINPMDLFTISGGTKDWMEHRFPLIPGVDAAGVVEGIGAGVTQFTLGDEVFGLCAKMVLGERTYAEYVVVPAGGLVARKPASLDFAQAAALPTPGQGALLSVRAIAPPGGGDHSHRRGSRRCGGLRRAAGDKAWGAGHRHRTSGSGGLSALAGSRRGDRLHHH